MTPSSSRIVLVVSLFFTGLARAQASSPPEPAAETARALVDELTGPAKSDYVAGRVLYQDRDYAGALVKFQHAYELSKDPRLLWNMAACEKNLRHYARMLRLVERYLKDGGALIGAEERRSANELVRTVKQLVSRVQLQVSEDRADVYVDGEKVGVTPLQEPILVDLGTRQFRISKPGFKQQVHTREVTGASDIQLSLTLEREPREGRLVILARGADWLKVDGRVVGRNHFDGSLGSGPHVISASGSDKLPYTSEVVLRAGEVRTLDVSLESKRSMLPTALWIAGGVAAAAGLGVGGYFLFRPEPSTTPVTQGTIGTVQGL